VMQDKVIQDQAIVGAERLARHLGRQNAQEGGKSVAALTGLCGVPSATDFRCQGAQVITRYRSCVPIKEGSRNGRQRLVEVGLQKRAGLVLEPTIERLLALGE
jgi:hypothetical protein